MYKIVLASVTDNLSGINLRLMNDSGDIQFYFLPKEQCGRIPNDKDPKKELELFAEVLIGKVVNIENKK